MQKYALLPKQPNFFRKKSQKKLKIDFSEHKSGKNDTRKYQKTDKTGKNGGREPGAGKYAKRTLPVRTAGKTSRSGGRSAMPYPSPTQGVPKV